MTTETLRCAVCKKIVAEFNPEDVTINTGVGRITCMDCHRKESVWPNYREK